MGVALFIGSLRARQQAYAITNPIGELVVAAGLITDGNYNEPVEAQSDDEVGELAQTFEIMRTTMKKYTENLESMVRERTEQLQVLLGEKEERLQEINSDLELARMVQQSLLPSDFSKTPGLKIAAFYRPQSAIGGDLYDVSAIDGNKTSILMFDVSGHGIAAALYGARALAEFTRCIRMGMNPESVLGQVHKELVKFSQDNRYLTAFLAFYDRSLGQFTFSRAGHPPAIVLRHGTGAIERLSTRGSYLGMNIGKKNAPVFEEKSITVQPGDRIVVFTDGVIECLSGAEEKFGSHRLESALAETREQTVESVVAEVVSRLEKFTGTELFNDDVTLICADVVGLPENLGDAVCVTGD
jgi:sigma-B regulation protein RsbU (phosphoserine phosphatase)